MSVLLGCRQFAVIASATQKIHITILGALEPLVAGDPTDAVPRTRLGKRHESLPRIPHKL